jgi:hypothetical protein
MLTRDRRMIKNQIFKFRSPNRKYESDSVRGAKKGKVLLRTVRR